MRRTLILIVGIALTTVLSASGCTAPDGDEIGVTGSIGDEIVVLSVPRLGLEPTRTAEPAWSRVTSVPVEVGQRVSRGEVVAVLDDAAARAGVSVAQASLAEARAQQALVGERADELADKQADVTETRAELVDTLTDLRARRNEVAGQLAQARRLAEQAPPGGLPPGAPPGAIPPGAAPPGAAPGASQDPRAIVAQLEAALAQIDEGIARAEDGLQRLDDADARLTEASAALDAASSASDALVEARQAGVSLAEALLARSAIRAPADGVLTATPALGEVLAAGAPLARLRPASAESEVVTFLTARQVRVIDVGDRAEVRIDSLPGRTFHAEVTRIGDEHVYVPSRFATRQIHLLRAVEVRLGLLGDELLPAGTPADITVYPK